VLYCHYTTIAPARQGLSSAGRGGGPSLVAAATYRHDHDFL